MIPFKQYIHNQSLDNLVEIALTESKIELSQHDSYIVELIKEAYSKDFLTEAPISSIQKRQNASDTKEKQYTDKAHEIIGKDKLVSYQDIIPGNFYHYKYRAKGYEDNKLDFYERNPLIVCIDATKKIILGLNFHYVKPEIRTRYLDVLKRKYGKLWDNDQTISLSWDDAKSLFGVNANRMLKAYIPRRISECYQLHRLAFYTLCKVDSSNFTPEVTKSTVWKYPPDIKGNNFKIDKS
jgi:hypothetical protein